MIQSAWAAESLIVDTLVVQLKRGVAGINGNWNRADVGNGIGQLLFISGSDINESDVSGAHISWVKRALTILYSILTYNEYFKDKFNQDNNLTRAVYG